MISYTNTFLALTLQTQMVYKKVNKGISMSIRDIGQRQGHSRCGGTGRVPKSMRTVLSSSGKLM